METAAAGRGARTLIPRQRLHPLRRRITRARNYCRPCALSVAPIWESSLRGRIPESCWNFWFGKSWWERKLRETLPWVAKFPCLQQKARKSGHLFIGSLKSHLVPRSEERRVGKECRS